MISSPARVCRRKGWGAKALSEPIPLPIRAIIRVCLGYSTALVGFPQRVRKGRTPSPADPFSPLHWPEVRGLCWGWEQGQARSLELSVQCREAEKVSPWAGCATDEPAADLPVMAEIQRLHGFVGSVISELREKGRDEDANEEIPKPSFCGD